MDQIDFDAVFEELTENRPFPWQRKLFEEFAEGRFPSAVTLPTGLGKTSVVAIWLVALAKFPDRIPRRLVYVVNRRTVVDQTTDEAEKLRRKAKAAGVPVPAISTLRGQFADNREWSADPSRPAIIVGTVDMIGSRLLFSGYGVGFKARPLHAGFLGQDVLLVHDEAHLEPAFQKLIEAVQCEQRRELAPHGDRHRLRVMELTATSRGGSGAFGLTHADHANELVRKRVGAKKQLELREGRDGKLADYLTLAALEHKNSNRPVLVFARTIDDVMKVKAGLEKAKQPHVETLTGTLRGKERDELVEKPVFRRFLPGAADGTETVYLVCTSAGEVGVNISADHLVSDLTPFDSMAQRFGRVNRFGLLDDTRVVVIYPKAFDPEDDYQVRQERTLALLRRAGGDASPGRLRTLHQEAMDEGAGGEPTTTDRTEALRKYILSTYQPQPTILPTSDILFDAWALTTVRDRLPGRPHIEPYLHGAPEKVEFETHVAWRREVDELRLKFEDDDTGADRRKKLAEFEAFAADLLEDYPLKPHELLREPSYRAFKHLSALAERRPDLPVWLVDDDDKVQVLALGDLGDKARKDRINGMTVLLPPTAGGLSGGQLDGSAKYDESLADEYDVADWFPTGGEKMRERVWDNRKVERGWRLVRTVEMGETEDGEPQKVWRWLVRRATDDEAGATGQARPYPLDKHNEDARQIAAEMVARLKLPADLAAAVTAAAGAHDLGKRREVWQRSIGNAPPKAPLAKSGHRRPPEQVTHYRHEFGSLLNVAQVQEFKGLSPDMQELALHLIGAHHGRGRPHFPPDEAFDPEPPKDRPGAVDEMAASVPGRFARLQRKYGRWGLAYLESLVRAADILASRRAEGGQL
jgi:CRISPR-associated endonuclease/helicase Cas3